MGPFKIAALFFSIFCALSNAVPLKSLGCHKRSLTFLVRNMDDGTDFTGISTLGPLELLVRINLYWLEVQASLPLVRAGLIGQEILDNSPDVVSLVEIPFYAVTNLTTGVTEVRYDSLAATMDVVKSRYRIAALTNLSSITFPFTQQGFAVTFMDREALLVSTAAEGSKFQVSNVQKHLYSTLLTAPSAIGNLTTLRGWLQLDLTVHKPRTQTIRVIGTHLEVINAIQLAQASQLLTQPIAGNLPTVLLGDFNSGPQVDSDVYNTFLTGGLQDVWTATHTEAGYTWALHPEDGDNATLNQRIDIIFFKNTTFFTPKNVRRIGELPVGVLWPSDHIGIFAELVLK